MFSHLMLGARDLALMTAFYDALLRPLGIERRPSEPDSGPPGSVWLQPGTAMPQFFVQAPFDGQPATVGNGGMVAFLAADPGTVDRAYAGGMAAGGTDAGPPGPRPHYGDGYYGAYLRDPEGNKVHVVHRGDVPT